jgi:hypothetical protein
VKVRVPIAGTVGKAVFFDPEAGARAEAAVAALAAQISAGIGGTIFHSSLRNLQVGDDHPQYTGWQFPETIVGLWNFQTIPLIQGNTLAEYIEDVVGGDFFDFLQDTSSVVWTYHETANELEANVPPEFVQDTVGAMLTTTSSITLAYDDGAGTFSATIVDEYIQDLVDALMIDSTSIAWTYGDVGGTLSAATINANPSATIGLTAVNGTAATPMRSDAAPALSQAIAPIWTGNHTFTPASGNTIFHAGNVRLDLDNQELQIGASQDLRMYHDGTDSILRTDVGQMQVFIGSGKALAVVNAAALIYTVTARPSTCLLTYNDPSGQKGYFGYDSSNNIDFWNNIGTMRFGANGVSVMELDSSATAGNTRMLVYDVTAGSVVRVSRGASDSGGTGFRVLRIPN